MQGFTTRKDKLPLSMPFVAIWYRLTEPSTTVHSPENRRQARLLSSLMLVFFLLIFLIVFVEIPIRQGGYFDPLENPEFIVGICVLLLTANAYMLSRTQYFTIGIFLLLGCLTTSSLIMMFPDYAPSGFPGVPFFILFLAVLLGNLLISFQGLLVLAIVSVIGTLLPVWSGEVPLTDILQPFAFLIIIFLLTIISSLIQNRNLLEIENQTIQIQQQHDDLKNTQAQLVQSAKLASLGEMATGMGHELNQPLMIIQLLAETGKEYLAEGGYDELADSFDTIQQQVDRAAFIVRHLKTFGRDTSYTQFTDENINQIIENTFVFITEQLRLNEVEVIKNLSENLPSIHCSSIQIEQVLLNLLLNAKDAVETAPKKQVHVRSFQENDKVVIEIKDFGQGISKENLEKIFDPFFTTKGVGKGTGLGLSISYGIIQNHSGTLKVTSQEGSGTTFRMELPLINPNGKNSSN